MKVLLFGKMLNLNDRIVDAYVGMCGCNPYKYPYEYLSFPDNRLNDYDERCFKESFEIEVDAAVSHHYKKCEAKDLLKYNSVQEAEEIINNALLKDYEEQRSWEAFQERISEPTKFTVLSEEEKEELVKKGILDTRFMNNYIDKKK